MMIRSTEYPGFYEVKAKFKIGDVVDYGEKTCMITKVCTLADHEDNYEASYYINELVKGRLSEYSIQGGAYESELTLNIKYKRDRELEKILGSEPSGRMTEDE